MKKVLSVNSAVFQRARERDGRIVGATDDRRGHRRYRRPMTVPRAADWKVTDSLAPDRGPRPARGRRFRRGHRPELSRGQRLF
jgi:hypothetical protein